MKIISTLLERQRELRADIEAAMEELRAIEISLNVFQNLGLRETPAITTTAQSDLFSPKQRRKSPELTIKQMIVTVLGEVESGLDAMAILVEINERWKKDYARTSLSPQLSRLKQEGRLIYVNQKWLLAEKDKASDVQPSEAYVGEPSKNGNSKFTTRSLTGSSLQKVQSRKEEES